MSQYQFTTNTVSTGLAAGALLIFVIFLTMWGCPQYSVYRSQMQGKALLAHAKYSKEVAVATANAKMESSTLLAAADTIRAHGIARSNEIIGQSLQNNESYLRWLFLDELKEIQGQIIYIPTEATMPIMEATRLQQPKKDSTGKAK